MDIKEKITKLLEKANSTTHEAEAETLLAKARTLMEEHQISVFDLGGDPFKANRGKGFQKGTQAQWRYDVEASLAEYLGLRVAIITFDHQPGERISRAVYDYVGSETAHITLDLMFPFVWGQILRLVNEETDRVMTRLNAGLWSPLRGAEFDSEYRKNQRNLLKHTAEAMQGRLNELTEAAKGPQAPTEHANALIRIGGELDAFFQDLYPNLAPGRERLVDPSAAARRLAEQVRLEMQVAAQTDPTRLLK